MAPDELSYGHQDMDIQIQNDVPNFIAGKFRIVYRLYLHVLVRPVLEKVNYTG